MIAISVHRKVTEVNRASFAHFQQFYYLTKTKFFRHAEHAEFRETMIFHIKIQI